MSGQELPLIERVARAIYAAQTESQGKRGLLMPSWEASLPWCRKSRMDLAKAAIDAIGIAALTGFDDDYMTSETHHPGYVLIPTATFERVCVLASSL